MKKLLAFALAIMVPLSLAACGETEVALETKTVNGVSMSVPGDFGSFADHDGAQMALNEDKTCVITVGGPLDGGGFAPSNVDEDSFLQSMYTGTEGVEVLSYDNTADCNGTPAVICSFATKNSSGIDLTSYAVMLFLEDGTVQPLSFSFSTGTDSALESNIDTVIASVALA